MARQGRAQSGDTAGMCDQEVHGGLADLGGVEQAREHAQLGPRQRHGAKLSGGLVRIRALQASCSHLPLKEVSEARRARFRDFSADRIRQGLVVGQDPADGADRALVPGGAHMPQGGFRIGGQGGSGVRLGGKILKRFPERCLAPDENRTPQALRVAELIVNGLAGYPRPTGDRGEGGPCAARNIDRRLKNGVLLVPVDHSASSTQPTASADQPASRRSRTLRETALARQRRG